MLLGLEHMWRKSEQRWTILELGTSPVAVFNSLKPAHTSGHLLGSEDVAPGIRLSQADL